MSTLWNISDLELVYACRSIALSTLWQLRSMSKFVLVHFATLEGDTTSSWHLGVMTACLNPSLTNPRVNLPQFFKRTFGCGLSLLQTVMLLNRSAQSVPVH